MHTGRTVIGPDLASTVKPQQILFDLNNKKKTTHFTGRKVKLRHIEAKGKLDLKRMLWCGIDSEERLFIFSFMFPFMTSYYMSRLKHPGVQVWLLGHFQAHSSQVSVELQLRLFEVDTVAHLHLRVFKLFVFSWHYSRACSSPLIVTATKELINGRVWFPTAVPNSAGSPSVEQGSGVSGPGALKAEGSGAECLHTGRCIIYLLHQWRNRVITSVSKATHGWKLLSLKRNFRVCRVFVIAAVDVRT